MKADCHGQVTMVNSSFQLDGQISIQGHSDKGSPLGVPHDRHDIRIGLVIPEGLVDRKVSFVPVTYAESIRPRASRN